MFPAESKTASGICIVSSIQIVTDSESLYCSYMSTISVSPEILTRPCSITTLGTNNKILH